MHTAVMGVTSSLQNPLVGRREKVIGTSCCETSAGGTMKTNQWKRKGAWESASGGGGAVTPVSGTSLALALLLISAIPPCTGAPVSLNPSAAENDKLLNQIDNACSSLLPRNQPLKSLDTLWELCDLMQGLSQKSQEVAARETTKRSTVFHPLLQLIPQLHSRRRRRVVSHEAPRMIQSRGYFLYRPRNGRRSTEYV